MQTDSKTPTVPFAPWPSFTNEQIEAVSRVLHSGKVNYWTGKEGRQFEEEFASYCDCQHAIAVANGTLALELALIALGIGPGDDVIVPCRTFIASASCIVARGARPIVCDIDRDSQTLTRETVEAVVTPRTKAIVAVHLAGWPCDMDPLLAWARGLGIAVIEDCAQAHGARYKGRPVGSIGDIGAFSFCQDKIITTAGEGGMLVTNNTDLWDKAWRYKDHGKTPDAFYNPQPPGATFRWLHESFGSNYRMTEVQSAVGRLALRDLPQWISARRENSAKLIDCCRRHPALRTPVPPQDVEHSYYKFYTFVDPSALAPGWTRDRIIQEVRSHGVPCMSGSCSEIYREAAFPGECRPAERLPVARELGETSLMFLVHHTLSAASIDQTCAAIDTVMAAATGQAASRAA